MSAMKTFAITATAVLCLSLAATARADAAPAPRTQAALAVTTAAAQMAQARQAAVPTLAGLFADLSAGMSHIPQAAPTTPDDSLMDGCEVLCCFEVPMVGIICCSRAEHVCWSM